MFRYAPLAAALAVAAALPAANAEQSGVYVSGQLGYNFQDDQASNSTGRALDLDFDDGGYYAVALGYGFEGTETGRIRAELELSQRENDVDDIVFNGNPQVGGGEQEVFAGLANVYYDFTGVSERITPFVGVGIGFAELDSDVAYNNGNATLNDSDTVFAYQFVAGASYAINDALSAVADVRYFALDDPELTRFGGPPPAAFTDQDSEYDSVSVSVGLRYAF